jgi:hypothetical protein
MSIGSSGSPNPIDGSFLLVSTNLAWDVRKVSLYPNMVIV